MISANFLLRPAPAQRSLAFAAIGALLLALPVVSACSKNPSSEAPTTGSGPVIARVNGVDIRESDLALAEEDLGAEVQAASPEAKREHLIAYLADMIMVAQAADKKKLADNPDFQRRLAFMRTKLLMGFELQEEAKAALSDEALHQTYDDAVRSMGGQEEVRARHILVDSEDEAKAVLDQLKAGGDFATLAKDKSKDPGAAAGGDLGYFTKEEMVPDFAEAAFKLKPGEITQAPVHTQFGWHVIKLEERRAAKPPSFDQVKPQLVRDVGREVFEKKLNELKTAAKIEVFNADGSKPGAPPPTANAPAPAAPARAPEGEGAPPIPTLSPATAPETAPAPTLSPATKPK